MPQIVACPLCQKQLQLPDSFVGKMVQCPECKHGFKATVNTDPIPMQRDEPVGKVPEWEKPPAADELSPSRETDNEIDRPKRKRASEEENGSERARRKRRYYSPHRGGMVLTMGILSLLCCPAILFGPVAWSMGNSDLTEIRAGRMDPEGEQTTQAGRICGIIGTVSSFLGFCLISSFCILSNAPMFRRR